MTKHFITDIRKFSRGAAIMTLAAACSLTPIAGTFTGAINSYAATTLGSGSMSYRVNVLNAVGVADSSYLDSTTKCTRSDFAKLLVLSGSLRDSTNAAATTTVTKDVAASMANSGYIRAALSKGWMRTRLGGNYAPNDAVTLAEAVRAVLKVLGYEDSDLGNDVSTGRMEMYKSLELNEGVAASDSTDTLSRQDAMNLIYNMLRTKTKDGSGIYGTAIKLTASSTGKELDVSEALDESLTGPVLVKTEQGLKDAIPFYSDSSITYYFNGVNTNGSGKRYLTSQLSNYGWVIIYYNEKSKSVWAYGSDDGNASSNYYCTRGTVNAIYYENDSIATPSSVVIGNTEYTLNSSDVKFMFSINGDIKLNDDVILVCKKNTNEDDSETDYYAVAVMSYYENSSDKYSNTIYAEEASKYTAVDSNGNPVVNNSAN